MPKNKKTNPFLKYLIAVSIGLFVFVLIVFILAFIIVKMPYPKENTLLYAIISIAVSSFVASFYFCIKERKNGLVSGLIIGAVLAILFFIIYTPFSSFNLDDSSLLIIPASIVPSSVAGITAVNIKRK